jgi:crotonobetainyl-CoA:carnitine CoA-transferase CaiB-like acyl-CoA transferase
LPVLSDLRVLDLSTDLGLMCGQLLADMGAEVQQWVLPDDAARLDTCHWQAYTLGKGVQLIDWQADPEAVRRQVGCVDVIIESAPPGLMARLGLGYEELARINPEVVHVSITGFGSTGPKADYEFSDLISAAAAGLVYVTGSEGQAPVRTTCPQAHGHASSDAAVGVLIALFERARTGRGQHVDVSAQQSTTLALLNRALDGPVGQAKAERSAYGMTINGVHVQNQFQARDGWVVCLPGVLPPIAAFMERLMAWVFEEGLCREEDLRWDWGGVALQIMQGQVTPEQWAPVTAGMEALIAGRTKAELMSEAISRRLLIAPVFSVADLLDSDHLAQRGFLVEGGAGLRLGPFARLSESPLPLTESGPRFWQERSAFDARPLAASPSGRDESGGDTEGGGGPLAGLKVLDLFWVVAGPGATRMLADYGATVVHVESTRRQDMVRNVPPYIDGVPDPERAACHHSTNTNKLNLTLDISREEGRAVLADLIRWADVFTESFAPGAVARMGFDYATVRTLNPNIIMISSCLMGQTGEWSGYAGFGNNGSAVSGFHALTGHPGQPPTGVFGPYTDFTSVRFNALAILGAVMHGRRTGNGQYIDMSQGEAALHFLAPECLRYLRDGRVRGAEGNRDEHFAPQGVYPTAGFDRWLALSVRSDAEWRALCALAGFDDLSNMSVEERAAAHDELDRRLETWMETRPGEELEAELQSAGIAAHRTLDTHELGDDPQLVHRGHFIPVAHREFSNAVVESSRLTLSASRAARPGTAPWFGIDNERVLSEILGYDGDRVRELASADLLS